MATPHGAELLQWLVERGWIEVPLQPGVMGDPQVKNKAGVVFNLYDAAKEQKRMTGEWPGFLPPNKD